MDDDEVSRQGGPAFPVSIPGAGDNGWHGMTLRDWFAGQALSAFAKKIESPSDARIYAETAYYIADAMLKAREEK